jgi:chromosome segregation ATPase
VSLGDKVKDLEREIERLEQRYDAAAEDRDDYERRWNSALAKIERLEDEQEADRSRPFRPDQKRMDRGDWSRASQYTVCEVCGCQFWEHATVQGYQWVHRICDGRLVKL